MKTLATIGDNCVDIYPQLNKAFSGGNAVNVAVYCTRYGDCRQGFHLSSSGSSARKRSSAWRA